jgi:hypothetical protein
MMDLEEKNSELEEKVKGKKRKNLQQPVKKNLSYMRGEAVLDKEMGTHCSQNREEESTVSAIDACYSGTNIHATSETNSLEEVMAEEEEEDEQQLDEYGEEEEKRITATKEKKEKRIPKEKEHSLLEVPGGRLLGPKMLAFIKAFPEGDVHGNDDIETSYTQRQRMEGWLEDIRSHKKNIKEIENGISEKAGSKSVGDAKTLNFKIELKNIEDKLEQAASSTGTRGSGAIILKPGFFQILMPYEVRFCLKILGLRISLLSLMILSLFFIIIVLDFFYYAIFFTT